LIGVCAFAVAIGFNLPAAQAQDTGVSPPATARPLNAATRAKAVRATPRHKAAQTGGGRYYIEFRSRYALTYGHTFTAFGRLNSRGEIATQEIAGLHPKGEGPELWTVGHLVPVPSETGPSDGDLEEEYISARYRIELNEADYHRVVAYIRQHQANSPLWHAGVYNCNAWTGDIARFMGLKTPFHLLMPPEYVNGIRELNNGVRQLRLDQQSAAAPASASPQPQLSVAPAAYSSGSDDRYPAR